MNESGRQKGNETERDTETRKHRERERKKGTRRREKSASATLSYANSGTPGGKGRMQISPDRGPSRGSPCKHVFFTASKKSCRIFFPLFFLSLSLSLFSPLLWPSSLCFPSIPSTVSSRYCSLSAHDFGKHRSTRIYFHANRATEWHTVCRQAERFSWQISNRSGLQRVETRERERGKKTTAEAQFIKFFPLA